MTVFFPYRHYICQMALLITHYPLLIKRMNRREFIAMGAASGAWMLFEQNAIGKALFDDNGLTAVLGGGAFAIGFALAHPQKTIVIERGIHLCADVALTADFAEVGTPSTPLGHELYDKLKAEGLLADGKVECPPLADFMATFFVEHGGTALTNTELVDLHKNNDGWKARLYGGGSTGMCDMPFANFLDTTDIGWRNFGADAIAGKRFGAITDKGYFSIDLPAAANWRDARLKLYNSLEQNVKGVKVLAESSAMKCLYKTNERIDRMTPLGCRWIPSAQFPTLLNAFEEGTKCNLA